MGMKTVEEIRHANLLGILAEVAEKHGGERGAIQWLADKMGRSHSQVSQLKTRATHSKTGKVRNIGPAVARLIEQAAGKDRGWLDREHGATAQAEQLGALVTRIVAEELDRRSALAEATPGKRQDRAAA